MKCISHVTDGYILLQFLSHLRFLLKSAEELASKKPTLAELQTHATTSDAVTGAVQSDLAVVTENQNLDHATIQEERDGRLNEK